jgi:hypothetical protein
MQRLILTGVLAAAFIVPAAAQAGPPCAQRALLAA